MKAGKGQVLILTFLGYAGLHAMRSAWPYAKTKLVQYTPVQKGVVDFTYIFVYSFTLLFFGWVGDRFSAKYFTGLCQLLASVSFSIFPIVSWLWGANYGVLLVGMALNGVFQSAGWPGSMKLVSNWYGKQKKGLILSIWASSANAGNILGELTSQLLYSYGYSYSAAMLLAGFSSALFSTCLLAFLVQKPESERLMEAGEQASEVQSEPEGEGQSNFIVSKLKLASSAFLIPKVPLYILSYSLLKGIVYGLLFWLAQFLAEKNQQIRENTGLISAMLDLGTFMGAVLIGVLSDQFNRYALFITPLLGLSTAMLLLGNFVLGESYLSYCFYMGAIGLLYGGPYNLISTAIAIDLGNSGSKEQVAGVAAAMEGTAGLVAGITQLVLPLLGVSQIFIMMGSYCLVACVATVPLLRRQISQSKKDEQ